jgi:hypothetical protein
MLPLRRRRQSSGRRHRSADQGARSGEVVGCTEPGCLAGASTRRAAGGRNVSGSRNQPPTGRRSVTPPHHRSRRARPVGAHVEPRSRCEVHPTAAQAWPPRGAHGPCPGDPRPRVVPADPRAARRRRSSRALRHGRGPGTQGSSRPRCWAPPRRSAPSLAASSSTQARTSFGGTSRIWAASVSRFGSGR